MKARLDSVIKSLSVANAAIKNTASPVEKEGWFPTFSASGQDVWLPEYRFDLSGIVVSAVGARCGKAFKADGKWNVCANTHALSVDESIADRDYCWYMLNNESWWVKGGTAQPFVKVKDSLKREHFFPTLSDQRKIVKQLDQINRVLELRREEIAFLDDLIKARFVEMFGDCRLNPKGWNTVALGDIAEVGSSKRVFVEELKETGIPFYRGTEVGAFAEGKTVIPELFITEEHYIELIKASGKPEPGDLLMPSICPDGRIWVVDTDEPFYFKDGRVLWVHGIDKRFDPVFLLYTLKDRIMTDYGSIASGTTFAELKIFALKQCQVFDVPIEVQRCFTAFIAQIDKSKVVIQKSLDETQLLFDSLMQKYFG